MRDAVPARRGIPAPLLVAAISAFALAWPAAAPRAQIKNVSTVEETDGGLVGVVPLEDGGSFEYVFGDYHALLIGIEKYPNAPAFSDLTTPEKDVLALRDVLEGAYGFKSANIKVLLDEDATRAGILGALDEYVRLLDYDKVNGRDNLLIYFAGHGQVRWEELKEGFWIPHDGTDDWHTWISGHSLSRMVQRIRAKVLVVSDSCFSGVALRKGGPPGFTARTRVLFERMSRQAITSGGNEPVADDGFDGHSLFAYHLLHFLQNPPSSFPIATELFAHVFGKLRETQQSPGLRDIGSAGDGEFVFTLARPDAVTRSQAAVPLKEGVPPGWRLPVFVEQIREDVGEDPENEFTRYRYIVKKGHPDAGAEMVLVPGGTFLDVNGRVVPVKPFLIDRYEVSFERFSKFTNGTGYQFDGGGKLSRKLTGDRQPAVCVTLVEARAFAKWCGKRVPDRVQWQLAARYAGEDGKPLRRHAWGDQSRADYERKLHDASVPVDSSTDVDRSFWGVVATTGGVREWCRNPISGATGIASGGRQVRGGRRDSQWNEADYFFHKEELAPSTRERWLGFRCILPLKR